jgi:hypothetical protein
MRLFWAYHLQGPLKLRLRSVVAGVDAACWKSSRPSRCSTSTFQRRTAGKFS